MANTSALSEENPGARNFAFLHQPPSFSSSPPKRKDHMGRTLSLKPNGSEPNFEWSVSSLLDSTPLHASSKSLNYICTTPRDEKIGSELIAPWNIGFLPQTITFSDYDEEDMLSSKPEGKPVEVIEVGSTAKSKSTYAVIPIAMLLISDSVQSNVIWKVIAISEDDPSLEYVESLKDQLVGDILCWYLSQDLFSKSNEMSKKNGKWLDAQEALSMVEESHRLWKTLKAEDTSRFHDVSDSMDMGRAVSSPKKTLRENSQISKPITIHSPERKFKHHHQNSHVSSPSKTSSFSNSKYSKQDSMKAEKWEDDNLILGCFSNLCSKPNQVQRSSYPRKGSRNHELETKTSMERLLKNLHTSSSISGSSVSSESERRYLMEKEMSLSGATSSLLIPSLSFSGTRKSSNVRDKDMSRSTIDSESATPVLMFPSPPPLGIDRRPSFEMNRSSSGSSHPISISPSRTSGSTSGDKRLPKKENPLYSIFPSPVVKSILDRKSSLENDHLRPHSPNSTLSLSTYSPMSSCEETLIREFIDDVNLSKEINPSQKESFESSVKTQEVPSEDKAPKKSTTKSHKRWALLRSALSFDVEANDQLASAENELEASEGVSGIEVRTIRMDGEKDCPSHYETLEFVHAEAPATTLGTQDEPVEDGKENSTNFEDLYPPTLHKSCSVQSFLNQDDGEDHGDIDVVVEGTLISASDM